jgi:hypothetical protein
VSTIVSSIPAIGESLGDKFPELISRAHGWDPFSVKPRSHQKKEWICDKGHISSCIVNDKTTKSVNCPMCYGRIASPGETDLATTHPEIAKEAYNWDATTLGSFSSKKVTWLGSCGHIWEMTVEKRVYRGYGCPYCSGHKVLTGFNDLMTTHPEIALELVDNDPTILSAGSHKKFLWQGNCGHKWMATVNNRTKPTRSTSCPYCVVRGYKFGKPGCLYLMYQPNWQLFQIGISNSPKQRIGQHSKNGWSLIDQTEMMKGDTAYLLEQSLLSFIRTKNIPYGFTLNGSKFDGYTESWPKEELFVSSIQELRQLVEVLTN